MNVGIYIYDGAEVLDFSGPFEVFSTASRVCGDGKPFQVFLVGQRAGEIAARGGYRIIAGYGLHNHPPIDVLIVAGGLHGPELEKAPVMAWIAATAAKARLVASVCTGVFLLAGAGVVNSENVTTHWEDVDDLRRSYPDLTVDPTRRWVDAGRVVTSAGISAGLDMSLYLVSRLHSKALAEKTARQMDFAWQREESSHGVDYAG